MWSWCIFQFPLTSGRLRTPLPDVTSVSRCHGIGSLAQCDQAGKIAVLQKLAAGGRFAGVACLGAVIRGDTPHFDYVAGEAVKGIGQVAAESGVPVSFGVTGQWPGWPAAATDPDRM